MEEEQELHIGDADLDNYKKHDQILKQQDDQINQLKH